MMKMKYIFASIVIFILFCFSSCFLYRDLRTKTKAQDIYKIHKEQKWYLFSADIFKRYRGVDIYKKKNIFVKLSYLLEFHNISLFDNPVIELHSFSFTNKNGDTIPCTSYYNYSYMNDSVCFKIDTFPFSFNIKEQITPFNILVEADQLYHETKIVYVSFDITVNNQRITKHKIKYKWKLCVEWLI